ncbi:PEP/pyruvate-binding domain-containing protein [Roseofilum casamattae]|uniref:PEP/pyruvate-binding domain-containing protein n=1 Tax=Roseofilum casamattae BLCC-M143 TaxID=3022442 RepID=A0ABT7BTL8_9CYAN|nr:PEP/pyruvate-binding domain-containing protein [Roseofilum casamattae]MDJ1182532.1 PEP/pyruvate-binding domain-containing protein [Roseofilum casamattae BLCC-M143]
MTYILTANAKPDRQYLGGKAASLARLCALDCSIPDWFAVSPRAFAESLRKEQYNKLEAGTISEDTAQWHIQDNIKIELEQALKQLCPNGEQVAVRSSAVDEDGMAYSFAGQLESFLFVPPEEVGDRIIQVWQSGFSDRILAYRQQHDLGLPKPPAVLVQRMVDAEVAGVAFAADPVTGQRGIVTIAATKGVGEGLVSGEVDGETYRINRYGELVSEAIADGLLTQENWQAIASLVREVSQEFGCPQDIEWAIANNRLYLLQSRPITSLVNQLDPDGQLNLWDNSNIAESYSGVTTPLTFSFARRAYEEVYRQFCILMGVPKPDIDNNSETFSRMLGLIQGRVYYNLLSWYKVLSLLPGFRVNRQFMEQMMGVKEGIPDRLLESIGIKPNERPSFRTKIMETFRLVSTVEGLLLNLVLLDYKIKRFYDKLARVLDAPFQGLELTELRADELTAYYRELERELLRSWDAPLINDFFAMIFYGILQKLSQSWCGDENGTLQNDLISGEGGMISAEPAMRVKQLAEIARKDKEVVRVLCEGELTEILATMKTMPELQNGYQEYLQKFGDRCLGELKLESSTLFDNPLTLLRSIGQLAKSPVLEKPKVPVDLRSQAEAKVRESLQDSRWKPMVFNWVLQNARARVRDRENLRFERTRLFGRVRRIFVELGKRFVNLDILEHYRDIFYLEVDEILGFVEGTATCTKLKDLVELRKNEFQEYEQEEIGDRFETSGIVYHGNKYEPASSDNPVIENSDSETIQGLGCCPGIVKARVRVIHNPENAVLEPGSILVAERTDPGWIMLFPSAAGVLVERGSLLSHSAIVAREMGIPAIVAIPKVTKVLQDGDWVEMDGSTGVVRRVNSCQ